MARDQDDRDAASADFAIGLALRSVKMPLMASEVASSLVRYILSLSAFGSRNFVSLPIALQLVPDIRTVSFG